MLDGAQSGLCDCRAVHASDDEKDEDNEDNEEEALGSCDLEEDLHLGCGDWICRLLSP